MYAMLLFLVTLNPSTEPVKLPNDVVNFEYRTVTMPSTLSVEWRDKIKLLRLFVSEDRGKTWKHVDDYEASARQVKFEAPHDGLYWFGVQLVLKDGTSEPNDLNNLRPQMKVFVNTSGKPAEVQKSYLELLRENIELRRRVDELEKRLAERKPR